MGELWSEASTCSRPRLIADDMKMRSAFAKSMPLPSIGTALRFALICERNAVLFAFHFGG
jgi:hypothetical protein